MKARIEFKYQDLWIGAFWTTTTIVDYNLNDTFRRTHLWLCLIPCFPLHLSWDWGKGK